MFFFGLLGSGHCIGMCGPLVIALPGRYGTWSAHLNYHSGRLLTYVGIGAVMGSINQGMAGLAAISSADALAWTTRVQISFSVVAAVLLVIMGLNRIGLLREPKWLAIAAPQKIPGFSKTMKNVRSDDMRWLFVMGLMLGLLPCGLSYGAFSRALAADSMVSGALLTASFGVGTLPGLLLLGTGFSALLRRYQVQFEILAGLIMIAMAASLISKAWTALF